VHAAAAAADGVCVRGDFVAIVGFDAPWSTAVVRVRGVPAEVVGRVGAVAAYARALHDARTRAYARREWAVPAWRSWRALCTRWPFLLSTPKKRTVYKIKPL